MWAKFGQCEGEKLCLVEPRNTSRATEHIPMKYKFSAATIQLPKQCNWIGIPAQPDCCKIEARRQVPKLHMIVVSSKTMYDNCSALPPNINDETMLLFMVY